MLYLTGDPSEIQKYHAMGIAEMPLHVRSLFFNAITLLECSNDISPNARIIRRFSNDVTTAGITVHRGIMEKGNRHLPREMNESFLCHNETLHLRACAHWYRH
jgi:hypothetical protein